MTSLNFCLVHFEVYFPPKINFYISARTSTKTTQMSRLLVFLSSMSTIHASTPDYLSTIPRSRICLESEDVNLLDGDGDSCIYRLNGINSLNSLQRLKIRKSSRFFSISSLFMNKISLKSV